MKKWAHNIQTPEDSVKIKFMEIGDEKHVGGYGYGLNGYMKVVWKSTEVLTKF